MSDFHRDPFRNGSYDRWKLASPYEDEPEEDDESPEEPDEVDTMTTSEGAPAFDLPLPAEYDEEA